MFLPIALATLVSMQAGAGANAAQTGDLEVRVQAQIEFAGGNTRVTAWENDRRTVDGYIHVNGQYCGLGTSASLPAILPTAGWHVSANVVERTADSIRAVVQWQRVWEHAAVNTHPATGVSTITLKLDEPLLLDTITPDPLPPCGATLIRLTASAQRSGPAASEARTGQRAWNFGAANPAASTGSGGGGRAGRGAGGAGAGPVTGSATGPGNGMGAGGVGARAGGISFESPAPGSVAAVDLWLLDRVVPTGGSAAFAVNQRYRMISLAPGGSDFAFDALLVDTSHGEVTARVYGRLIPVLTNGKLTSVDVQINRALKSDGTPPIDVNGGATHTLSPLNASDVVEFEMPSGERDDPALLGSHHLSLRVRVR